MIGFIIWIIGLILTIKAAIEIWNAGGDVAKRLLIIIVMLILSWIGLLIYYFYAKDKIADWVK